MGATASSGCRSRAAIRLAACRTCKPRSSTDPYASWRSEWSDFTSAIQFGSPYSGHPARRSAVYARAFFSRVCTHPRRETASRIFDRTVVKRGRSARHVGGPPFVAEPERLTVTRLGGFNNHEIDRHTLRRTGWTKRNRPLPANSLPHIRHLVYQFGYNTKAAKAGPRNGHDHHRHLRSYVGRRPE